MTQACLDTTFVVDYLREKKKAMEKAHDLRKENIEPVITSISATELFHGAYRSPTAIREKRIQEIRDVLQNLPVLPLDTTNIELVGEIRATLLSRGEDIGYADAAIAGIALSRQLPLLTQNVDHFKRVRLSRPGDQDVQLEIWTW